MKHILSVILGLVCLALGASLFVSNRNNSAQYEKDAEEITSTSNLLSSAQTDLSTSQEKAINFSNLLESSRSTSLTFSNELVEAKSAFATAKEGLDRQISDLNRQISNSETESQALSQHTADLTNQVAGFTNQIALLRSNWVQAVKDYALLENRFRRDVAERVVVERKFNNLSALNAQIEELKRNPANEISENRIREGLDVVVKSNVCYVIAPE